MLFEANEDFIVKVQALIRGYLARQKFKDRMEYFKEQEPNVVKIQVLVKFIVWFSATLEMDCLAC